jgi:hypothetical protein|tara:strand:- start:111 stop:965 length:855 start_codon:yes stop_codon:yes gene_type:complete
MIKNFAAFILSHGRANNVITYDTLIKTGYTGDIYIIIDNEDKTAKEYYDKFGDKVVMFDKKKIAKTFDEADNFNDRRAIVYARNACFDIAKDLGIKYFIQLDDDYTTFSFAANDKGEYITSNRAITKLDKIFEAMLNFYKSTNIHSIAMAQGGDFIGGGDCRVFKEKLARKCMNSFICSTDRPFQFVGRINEDVNNYTHKGSLGYLFFTIATVRLEQKQTQSNEGGMTDIYLDNGTYIKSFYSIIFQPSSVTISLMGNKNNRLHHRVNWNATTPVILDEKYKKI